MAESNLQRKLAYLNTLYEIYQEQGIHVTGSQMTNTEYAQFAYLKYLLFLANQDRIITEEEVTYCNVCLQKNLTRPAVERFFGAVYHLVFRCDGCFTRPAFGDDSCRSRRKSRRWQRFSPAD